MSPACRLLGFGLRCAVDYVAVTSAIRLTSTATTAVQFVVSAMLDEVGQRIEDVRRRRKGAICGSWRQRNGGCVEVAG